MITVNIHVYGIVQGVGFRPFTSVAADKLGIKGTVSNKGSYVEIIAQGEPSDIERFEDIIRNSPPERSVIMGLDSVPVDEKKVYDSFEIIESEKEYGDIFVSPDIATCDKCKQELFDKTNRRYLHPFINCTQCGPRLTILDSMPYDRVRTTMGKYPMCDKCAEEYYSPQTRRYDAQPVCCNDCGPEVYIIGEDTKGLPAITKVRKAIMDGKIIAIKGIGGFHLCCDAKNKNAVMRLRKLKRRPMKPFAVMMKDINTVQRECIVTDGQESYLTGWQKPIMLLEKREKQSICDMIAPDNLTVGVMLPYAPVQMLLFDCPDDVKMTDCLVMTSGNARGAPICRNDEDAVKEIGSFCDMILSHNRDILIRADDSVCDWFEGKPYMIRRSRGFAPLPVMVKGSSDTQSVAIGGELKNSFCIAKGNMLYLSPYVGDMGDIRTLRALDESLERMCDMLEVTPTVVISDKHPSYNTVSFAEEYCEKRSIPLKKIQHHYAHILSCMAENDHSDKVIGVSFDGNGYGDDGTIWGGEIFIGDRSCYERVGSIRPFKQVGGDASSKEGWRIAIQLIRDCFGDKAQEICEELSLCKADVFKVQSVMADKSVNTVISTSCGRLFDAVSAVLGIRQASTFEGEASTALMYEAQKFIKRDPHYDKQLLDTSITDKDGFITLDTTLMFKDIVSLFLKGIDRGELAYCFHLALSEDIVKCCIKLSKNHKINTVALSGGVFQNKLLLGLVKGKLIANGINVLIHSLVPPNDGGIALGQAYYSV
ncbi:MAG: carbamoyltransferase HypF [Ruminococcus sp.]|nr:carbamoyltransferase HypF [Ruminococcus sp.]